MSDRFVWASSEGHSLARRILTDSPLLYDPHDYQIEGVCVSLDGVDLLAITPTGSGKTGFYTMYMLIILAVVKDPNLCPTAKFPSDPCLIVIAPTIPLQIQMADKMKSVGLTALAINSDTRSEAQKAGNEELWLSARQGINVIVAGPEQLKSDEFEHALRDDKFFNRSCGVGFDEVHLLNVWGPQFRQDFLQMGFVKARMSERHNPWILTTATLRDGHPYNNVISLLGLTPGQFHVIRRSNARPEVQILFRELTSSLGGTSFPELDWILTENRSTVIFPKTLTLASNIYIYLASKCTPAERSTRVRLYSSINFPSHNATELMNEPTTDKGCQIVIGTDTLSVGIDMAARQDAIIIGDVEDSDELFQKAGRVGRHPELVDDARVIVYIAKSTRTAAEKALKQRDDPMAAKPATPPDLSMAEMIVAECKVKAQNRLYSNPTTDPRCKCGTCTKHPPPRRRRRCNCSGCIPENIPPVTKPAPPPKAHASIPKRKRLSKIQKAHGTRRLLELQRDIWRQADRSLTSFLPPEAFLSSAMIKKILDIYVTLDSLEAVGTLLNGQKYLQNHHTQLLDFLRELKPEFQKIAAARKAELMAARALKLGVVVESDTDESEGNSEEEDEQMDDGEEKASEDGKEVSPAEKQPRYHYPKTQSLNL
ncbi:P-loop containing nucleoside triphosphate hydrolase protein [Mycena latifolia]|nr:P-loop containing nucleoside triphosphate hydrolase protein [Mycena latifolia]